MTEKTEMTEIRVRTAAFLAHPVIVEEEVQLSLEELCQACDTEASCIQSWVIEGALDPVGHAPQDWRFSGDSLRRARLAQRLSRDLGVDAPGIALALDLLEEIGALRLRLERAGLR
jgi:chaperone modulatory protein CbpM